MARSAPASIPLGSLTQAESRSDLFCESCGSDRVTQIEVTLTDGSPVRLLSCRSCEHRSWEGPDGALDLGDVLDASRKRT
jgi:hypothetical protein